jgi:transaldolase
VINTMPEKTLRAFAEHGDAAAALDTDLAEVDRTLGAAEEAGLDLATLTAELEREGVESFCASYRQLIACIESKLKALASDR